MKVKFKIERRKEGLYIDGQLIVKVKENKGIVEIENGSSGSGHSCHPNIHSSGSVIGMKKNGGWGKKDEIVRTFGWQFNKSLIFCSDTLDMIAHEIEYNSRWDLVRCSNEVGFSETRTFDYNPQKV